MGDPKKEPIENQDSEKNVFRKYLELPHESLSPDRAKEPKGYIAFRQNLRRRQRIANIVEPVLVKLSLDEKR